MIASLFLVAQQTRGGGTTFLLSLLLMVAVFYFLLLRPQQRRARQQRELIGSLAVGDEVITIGGLYGRITAIDDDSVTLDIGAGEARFVRQAIARKFVPGDQQPEPAAEEPYGEEADEQP